MPTVDPTVLLGERIEQALVTAFGEELRGTDPVLRRSTHADYQANVALSLKGKIKKAPREIAQAIIDAANLDGVCDKIEIAGPGFLNITLSPSYLEGLLERAASDQRLGLAPAETKRTTVVDYSAPNVAKEMHVGHLRSTIIGDAICRLLEFRGHPVIRQNHLGDWGTQFGMLIEHLVDLGIENAKGSVSDLNEFYRQARRKFDEDPEFAQRARARVVSLQGGDEETLGLWATLVDQSKAYLDAVYQKLGVTLQTEHIAGESRYNAALPAVVNELSDKGLAQRDDGALCVFLDGFTGKGGTPLPLIIQKSDGGYGYATTDLAAIKYRAGELGGTRLIYVVGSPQAQHLSMVFRAAELAGWLPLGAVAEHAQFGSMLGADGKMFKTRSGDTVKLLDLLSEAEERAKRAVDERSPDTSEAERRQAAHAIGMGAIKYADLSSDRIKDYVFDWDRMLAFEGNTGPYLMYAHARARSILRKADTQVGADAARLRAPEERALAIALLSFESAVRDVERTLEPHRLCTYLYDLAQTFSAFFERCPVLKSEGEERAGRLLLCEITSRTLKQGLALLGIEAPERM